MAKRVLIIGGYGNFGRFIAKRLGENPALHLIIAGRHEAKARFMAKAIEAKGSAEGVRLDITEDLDTALEALKPDIVIHTSGPFQGQGYDVARACIRAGCHYIDLADGREFVSGIDALDAEAKAAGVSLISGASSVPALSSAVMDVCMPEFERLEHIDYGITTAQATTRGLATTAAILGYTGKAFGRLEGGKMKPAYGWQGLHAHSFPGVGTRYLSNCDIPDLSLFPTRYPGLKTQRFYAGLELPFLHIGLWGLSWLVRARLVRSLRPWAGTLLRASFLFDMLGTDTSAFYLRARGKAEDGQAKELRFDLTARSGDGPFIPCMPAIILANRLANRFTASTAMPTGATACMGLITLDEYQSALSDMDINWNWTGI
ncbi:saccharopine dehydrogenase family protein [Kordiimonas lipolytica]|uniref:Saccharopine dehydrogenase family protein n=1 Tax=Kordiimonas lipolytica TaxID=1662421 RepID=A0ABV8U8R3_9PROT|nr:saccharopine dehydrogenase NADP-binding domain-containing protein [Kordiimonas lipolytica]